MKKMHDIKLIVIDYLQLLRSTTRRAQDNRQLEIAEISAGIKGLAKNSASPSLFSRSSIDSPKLGPVGNRGSATCVNRVLSSKTPISFGLLVRAEVYEDDDEGKQEKAGEAELIIAKQRNGPVGEVKIIPLLKETHPIRSSAE